MIMQQAATSAQFNYSDKVTFGIQDHAVRSLLSSYLVLVLVSSWLGDTLILVGSLKYRVFKRLQSFIVTLVEHIAICDLVLTVSLVMPTLASLIVDGQVLFGYLCAFSVYLYHTCMVASLLLVATMTTAKVFILKFPLRAHSWFSPGRNARMICAALWGYACCYLATLLIVDPWDVIFDYRTYSCDYGFRATTWSWLQPLNSVLIGLIPVTVVVIATSLSAQLLLQARRVSLRAQGRARWQGLVTVLTSALVFCLSFLPYSVYCVLEFSVTESEPGPFRVHFYRTAFFFTTINIMANFYIYSVTVRGFKRFLVYRLKLVGYYLHLNDKPISARTSTSCASEAYGLVIRESQF